MTLQRSRLWPRGQRQTFFNTFKLGKNGQAIGMGYSPCWQQFYSTSVIIFLIALITKSGSSNCIKCPLFSVEISSI